MPNSESNKNGWKDHHHECNHEHEHKHHEKKEECCCKDSMKKALELLSDKTLKGIDFNNFVFVGKRFIAGSNIREDLFANDNISNPIINGVTFKGFDNCNCDLVSFTSTSHIYYPTPNNNPTDVNIPSFTANHMSLCNVDAVAFNYDPAKVNPDSFDDLLTLLLDEYHKKCYVKCDECCCNDGIFNAVYNPYSPNNLINFTAGWLAVTNAKVLGKVGSVLVLSSTVSDRIYLVCLDSIGFIND
ncbi:MAG: CotA family spore coat protein [Romboutsia sp.]|uniref:CotA family spore coat protein n=1 Tax=Romboutsia sp. TaxID=1965302 RepID=UPI003F300FE1